MIIFGAGMSGCLAALLNPQAIVYEAQKEPPINHNAVLRFRDDSVSKVTGIPFKKVKVYKSIFTEGKHVQPSPKLCNLYSNKVIGKYLNRSIWNLDPVERYVAPQNFQEQLYDLVRDRVQLDTPVEDINQFEGINISTLPMPLLCKLADIDLKFQYPMVHFDYQSIHVFRFTIQSECNINQTIYYPILRETNVYRATITGDQLIIESKANDLYDYDEKIIIESFGLMPFDLQGEMIQQEQKYGKIAPIDDWVRRQLLYKFTSEYGIYSAGRFAIWKNVLMDDVLQDLRVIQEMQAKDGYEHNRRA